MSKSLLVLKTECIKFKLHIKELLLIIRILICGWNNYLQIEEVLILQIEELSVDQRTICGLKNYLQIRNYVEIEIQSAYQRSILSADQRII